jgi:hypothetical protein
MTNEALARASQIDQANVNDNVSLFIYYGVKTSQLIYHSYVGGYLHAKSQKVAT